MTKLPNATLHVQCNLHQNSNDIHYRDWKSTIKFIWKHKSLQIAKAILNKRSYPGGITIPDFQLYYRANKNSMELAQKQIWRTVEQIEDPDTNSHSPPDFWQRYQKQMMEIRRLLIKCWGNWISACRKRKLDLCLSSCTTINSK
jgi:hypothetical protein